MWALSGSGPDGAEEIKRHVFYSTIDWNVSVSVTPSGFQLWGEGLLLMKALGVKWSDSMACESRAGLRGASNCAPVCVDCSKPITPSFVGLLTGCGGAVVN